MRFKVFRRFTRRSDAVGDADASYDTSTTSRIVSKKKRHTRGLRFQTRRFDDIPLDQNINRTGRDSFTSDGTGSNDSVSNSSGSNGTTNNGPILVEVGRPPKRLLQKKERMTFKIHDFSQGPHKRGESCITPLVQAHGYNWKLQVYPRGDSRSNETSEYVSCFLHYFISPNDRQPPAARVEYHCGSYKTKTQVCAFSVDKGKCSTSWGLENFIRRDLILRDCLDDDGALSIDIDIQIAVDPKAVWYPPLMRPEPTLMKLYHSAEETGDATFRLTTISKSSRSTPASFCHHYKAHKMILSLRAKILYELVCEETTSLENDHECDAAVVDLPEIDRDTFEAMLEHIYTVKQPVIRDEEAAKNLLVAADRFCLADLKLYVESVLVDRFSTVRNAASMLLFADSHSCALLKETAMDLYANDPSAVIQTPCWDMVEESEAILSELSKHVHTGCRRNFHIDNGSDAESHTSDQEGSSGDSENDGNKNPDKKPNDLDRLDVFSIREQLCEHGLDLDGTREILLERLRNLQQEEGRYSQ